MLKRLLLVLSILIVSGSILSACGGGDEASEGGTEGGTAMTGGDTGGAAAITVKTSDGFKFDPADVSANAGQEVDLTLDNTGQTLEHTWVLLKADVTKDQAITVQDQGDEDKKLQEFRVQPGATNDVSFTAPEEPGTYIVVCAVAGHAAGGMVGSFTVTGDSGAMGDDSNG
jgi:uncharacterized cupredoxin-like copper-binding protein